MPSLEPQHQSGLLIRPASPNPTTTRLMASMSVRSRNSDMRCRHAVLRETLGSHVVKISRSTEGIISYPKLLCSLGITASGNWIIWCDALNSSTGREPARRQGIGEVNFSVANNISHIEAVNESIRVFVCEQRENFYIPLNFVLDGRICG